MVTSSILWRKLDEAGHEACRILEHGSEWRLEGIAVFVYRNKPCQLVYNVVCGSNWATKSAKISGWVGAGEVTVEIIVGPNQQWTLNGNDCPGLADCIDVDLNFSPSTNLLPIKRLSLPVGKEARVKAAWLSFPDFEVTALDQIYFRLDQNRYRYEALALDFVTEFRVGDDGFIEEYPGLWSMVARNTQ